MIVVWYFCLFYNFRDDVMLPLKRHGLSASSSSSSDDSSDRDLPDVLSVSSAACFIHCVLSLKLIAVVQGPNSHKFLSQT